MGSGCPYPSTRLRGLLLQGGDQSQVLSQPSWKLAVAVPRSTWTLGGSANGTDPQKGPGKKPSFALVVPRWLLSSPPVVLEGVIRLGNGLNRLRSAGGGVNVDHPYPLQGNKRIRILYPAMDPNLGGSSAPAAMSVERVHTGTPTPKTI
jgi:hypothetical protein